MDSIVYLKGREYLGMPFALDVKGGEYFGVAVLLDISNSFYNLK